MTWPDELPTMPLDGLQSVFVADTSKARQLSEDRRLVRRSATAIMLDGRRLQNCLEFVGTLPGEGESYHMVSEKKFSMAHIIGATLTLAAPATISYLGVATLSFSKQNATDLLSMLDSGRVKTCDFCYSVYFRSNNRADCEHLAEQLAARGCRIFAGLIHSKILLMQLSDGRAFVCESSANLRSCSSIEQFCLTHDAALLRFHRAWISELMEGRK